jgi:hypothetical protein
MFSDHWCRKQSRVRGCDLRRPLGYWNHFCSASVPDLCERTDCRSATLTKRRRQSIIEHALQRVSRLVRGRSATEGIPPDVGHAKRRIGESGASCRRRNGGRQQEWARPHGPHARVGQGRNRCVDHGGAHHRRDGVPGHQQGGPRLGERHHREGAVDVVRAASPEAGIAKLAPLDLRRTCARLCHLAGGELDQIQFLLGHVSIQTTERYLRCKQKLRHAVNDRLGIEPDAA